MVGVGVTYVKDGEDIVPLLKASCCRPRLLDLSLVCRNAGALLTGSKLSNVSSRVHVGK